MAGVAGSRHAQDAVLGGVREMALPAMVARERRRQQAAREERGPRPIDAERKRLEKARERPVHWTARRKKTAGGA